MQISSLVDLSSFMIEQVLRDDIALYRVRSDDGQTDSDQPTTNQLGPKQGRKHKNQHKRLSHNNPLYYTFRILTFVPVVPVVKQNVCIDDNSKEISSRGAGGGGGNKEN